MVMIVALFLPKMAKYSMVLRMSDSPEKNTDQEIFQRKQSGIVFLPLGLV
jgi:hypothetical protein